jgi:hypothetical protein
VITSFVTLRFIPGQIRFRSRRCEDWGQTGDNTPKSTHGKEGVSATVKSDKKSGLSKGSIDGDPLQRTTRCG